VKRLSHFSRSMASQRRGLSVTSFMLDTTEWREVERSDRRLVWLDASGDVLSVDMVSTELPSPADVSAILVAISEFKATCLATLERVHRTG
jgi:hypothetical protein